MATRLARVQGHLAAVTPAAAAADEALWDNAGAPGIGLLEHGAPPLSLRLFPIGRSHAELIPCRWAQ